jgi:tRNA dimethylallyltransferase
MKRVIFLVGPTATGKSKIAIKLARKIDAEIISCDSMQIYKEMDILSAKPTSAQRRLVRHYLIDELSVSEKFSAADYLKKAKAAIKKIHKRGKTALVVGRTGLYMQILLDGIFAQPRIRQSIRKSLYRQAERRGVSFLYKRLKEVDAHTAANVHSNDLRRIIRALEVFEATGIPLSCWHRRRSGGIWGKFDIKIFGLSLKREELYRRINLRVERMFRKGLVSEVRRLITKRLSKSASQAIGIKQVREYLEQGCSLKEVKERVKLCTRRFAKRQLTWFRRENRIDWIKISGDDAASLIAERLAGML